MRLTIEAGQAEKLAGLFALAMEPNAEHPREYLQGVWLQVAGDCQTITAMATNGKILGSLEIAGKCDTSGEVLIPNTHPLMTAPQWQRSLKNLWTSEVEILADRKEKQVIITMWRDRANLQGTRSALEYNYENSLTPPDWRRVIPSTNGDSPRRGVCLNPAYLAAYFQARYGKQGDKHMLLDTSGEETIGMRWYDLKDDTVLGMIMPLRLEGALSDDHPFNRAKAQ